MDPTQLIISMYKDSHVFLDRKKQKFDNFIAVLG